MRGSSPKEQVSLATRAAFCSDKTFSNSRQSLTSCFSSHSGEFLVLSADRFFLSISTQIRLLLPEYVQLWRPDRATDLHSSRSGGASPVQSTVKSRFRDSKVLLFEIHLLASVDTRDSLGSLIIEAELNLYFFKIFLRETFAMLLMRHKVTLDPPTTAAGRLLIQPQTK